MSFYIPLWVIPVVLIFAPVIVMIFHKDKGGYGPDLWPTLLTVICWCFAIGIIIGKYVF